MSAEIRPPLAIQTVIFGQSFPSDEAGSLDRVLGCVKNAGFDAVEAGHSDPAFFHRLLRSHGLVQAADHITISSSTDAEPILRQFQITGALDVCNSGLLKWNDLTRDDYARGVEALNTLGCTLRREGIHLHYHHHDFEFQPLNGTTGMDLLLGGLDFSVVDLCVDTGWVWRAGQDPASFLRAHPDKIGYLHLKDATAEEWTELGRGQLDWTDISDAVARLPHVRWAVYEQDATRLDPVESCAMSRRHLRETFGY